MSAGYPAEGEQFGPFHVVRRIGGGGMGAVFEAVDQTLDRRVALKVIAPHLASDAGFRARFAAEAQALAALDSPHVVHVYTHGEQSGRPYIATQLIPGGDLAQLIDRAGVPGLRAGLDLVAQVAAGLADTHAAGLVHRDVKPANVLLRRRGDRVSAYLGDFGVACRIAGEDGPGETGTIGTPAWMAPELHAGVPAGVASDVYSLGCLMWATLTGRPPYDGASEDRLVAAHRRQPVPQLRGGGPLVREANRILRKAMAKDPAGRYGSARELRDDLRRSLTIPDRDQGASPAARRSALAAVALLAVVAASIAASTAIQRDHATQPPSGPTAGDESRAVTSLARALTDQGLMSRTDADCTARRWIAAVGLPAMVEAGYFDAHLAYVDQDRSTMTARIESAAANAARACAKHWAGAR